MRHPLTVLTAAALVAGAADAHAGGWTQPTGALYLKLWERSLFGDRAYLADGSSAEVPETFVDQALNLYLEYGLTDALTLVAFGSPVGYAAYGDESAVYVGPLAAGLRYGLPLGRARVAVEAHYGYAPDVGTDSLGGGVVDGEPFAYVPTVETHRVEGELQLGVPLSFGWTTASAGYRWLSHDDLDPVLYGFAQLGWQASAAWVLDLHFNLHEPSGVDIEATNVAGAGQTRYLGFGVGASWWFAQRWALALGFEGVAYAQSNAATPTLTVGVEYSSTR